MVDIWLLFSLAIPFAMVLLSTLIDSLRLEEDDRIVNHHGKAMKAKDIPTNLNKITKIA